LVILRRSLAEAGVDDASGSYATFKLSLYCKFIDIVLIVACRGKMMHVVIGIKESGQKYSPTSSFSFLQNAIL
jgi:hypothetical protein